MEQQEQVAVSNAEEQGGLSQTPEAGGMQAEVFPEWIVEATQGAAKDRDSFSSFLGGVDSLKKEASEWKQKAEIKFANPLSEKFDSLARNGATAGDLKSFIEFQSLDASTLTDADALRMYVRATKPAFADAVDEYIEEELGLKGFTDPTELDGKFLKARIADKATEARNWINQQKVASEMPESVRQSVEAREQAARAEFIAKEQAANRARSLVAPWEKPMEVELPFLGQGVKATYENPKMIQWADGKDYPLGETVAAMVLPYANDPATASFLADVFRKGLTQDYFVSQVAAKVREYDALSRAGKIPVAPVAPQRPA